MSIQNLLNTRKILRYNLLCTSLTGSLASILFLITLGFLITGKDIIMGQIILWFALVISFLFIIYNSLIAVITFIKLRWM